MSHEESAVASICYCIYYPAANDSHITIERKNLMCVWRCFFGLLVYKCTLALYHILYTVIVVLVVFVVFFGVHDAFLANV